MFDTYEITTKESWKNLPKVNPEKIQIYLEFKEPPCSAKFKIILF